MSEPAQPDGEQPGKKQPNDKQDLIAKREGDEFFWQTALPSSINVITGLSGDQEDIDEYGEPQSYKAFDKAEIAAWDSLHAIIKLYCTRQVAYAVKEATRKEAQEKA